LLPREVAFSDKFIPFFQERHRHCDVARTREADERLV
jgi:hypothetical protein